MEKFYANINQYSKVERNADGIVKGEIDDNKLKNSMIETINKNFSQDIFNSKELDYHPIHFVNENNHIQATHSNQKKLIISKQDNESMKKFLKE